MANNFITNSGTHKTLKGRLNTLISVSDELKFLVGFFYFSGWKEVYEGIKANENLTIKLLVGLQVDHVLTKMVTEHGHQESDLSQDDIFNRFITSLGNALNNQELDTREFYEQVEFFLELLEQKRLLIRKTLNPNHAKLYLFRYNEEQKRIQDRDGQFVTGSSNLTKAGLLGQEEFNVEIKDYGYPEADAYFEDLWQRAVRITEVEGRWEFVLNFIRHKTQAATVTPFEAYALILKTYLDLQKQKQLRPDVEGILQEIGFERYSYQIDAVNQALTIIEAYNGVIIADVVGLGKSVIASLIAKHLGKRGMVICAPGLIGDKDDSTGWWGYINQFKLYDWEVRSKGKLIDIAGSIHDKDIEVVIIDEAHYFRNQDTEDYEALLKICSGRQVILLTATPFNNSPADIFSMLKLFLVPGKSGITIDDNLEALFSDYNNRFKRLSYILKNHLSTEEDKIKKSIQYYEDLIGEKPPIDRNKVEAKTMNLATEIKNVISPVVIRRNRLDLKSDHQYSSEISGLSEVENPVELFFELSKEQSDFYDRILHNYFSEDGQFTGAIYQPFKYEHKTKTQEKMDESENRAFQQQRNLFDFMRRLLVKRFESSFGAFLKSIERFIKVHEIVQEFIGKTGGKYILDRNLIESIYEKSEDEIFETLYRFENDLLKKKTPKNTTVYDVNNFHQKESFLNHIESDKQLFTKIKEELEQLNMVNNDPKLKRILQEIKNRLIKEPNRKIILFSEFSDTVVHLKPYFEKELENRVLICDGKMSKTLKKSLESEFNAQYRGIQTNDFNVLVTTDKLSEGFNLNRAGIIINYDIPWNPTRVIQRVGRINRIGVKVFDKLFIYNFFPSEAGADFVKSREIASQKMFLIHNALGEDVRIFSSEEEPSAAGLYKKINESIEDNEDVNTITQIRNLYHEICTSYPEVIKKISQLPPRVKSAKSFEKNELLVLRKKGLSLQTHLVADPKPDKNKISEIVFEEMLSSVQCPYETAVKRLSVSFWPAYEAVKSYKPIVSKGRSERSMDQRALTNLKVGLKLISPSKIGTIEFMKVLIKDIRHYHTLADMTLRRIGQNELTQKSSEKDQIEFFKSINQVRKFLGDDYLKKILDRVKHLKTEVIIAVENQRNIDNLKMHE